MADNDPPPLFDNVVISSSAGIDEDSDNLFVSAYEVSLINFTLFHHITFYFRLLIIKIFFTIYTYFEKINELKLFIMSDIINKLLFSRMNLT